MTPQDQEFVNIPGVQYGDCQRACIASLLDIPIADVPHFLRDADGDAELFWDGVYDFVEARGFEYVPMQVNHQQDLTTAQGFHIIGGPSPRGGGLLHAVVGKDGAIYFDPHPSKDGLAGDPSEWTFDYIVRVD